MKTHKFFRFLLALSAVLAFAPGVSWATSSGSMIDVNDSATASGTGWTYAAGVFTVTGDVTITGTSTANRIVVNAAGSPQHITLNGANIDRSADATQTASACAFNMTGATVFLTLAGTSTLKSGDYCAGLEAPDGATLTIDGAGKLTATGGQYSAGIGGGYIGGFTQAGGNITINSGEVEAYGGTEGAGIGGGYIGLGGIITINGGTVTAKGGDEVDGDGGAGIGGGAYGNGGFITITGGAVKATGGSTVSSWGGAGIGGGIGGNGGVIVIRGGTVEAYGGESGAGIGGGRSGAGGTLITITDSAIVKAVGGPAGSGFFNIGGGAGIGSGGAYNTVSVAAGTIKITTIGNVTANGGQGFTPGTNNGQPIGEGGHTGGMGAAKTAAELAVSIDRWSATVTQTTGGAITPAPANNIPDGANQTFSIKPAAGYTIDSVTVDGTLYSGAYPSWTIPFIASSAHTITATFAPIPGWVSATAATAVPALNPAGLAFMALALLGVAGWGWKQRS